MFESAPLSPRQFKSRMALGNGSWLGLRDLPKLTS